ncbi:MAG TPA: ABC transporter substrate-binding protein [Beijerinckiaceae bacterium]|nr:ABC transporter substrate-binding protein [Beijerinckiaceae bacterium]
MRMGRVVFIALSVLAGAGSSSAMAAAPKPYDIDVIVSLTGGGAFLGKEEHASLLVAEKAFNKTGGVHGRPIRFVFHDDQSSPQLSVQLAHRVIAGHAPVLLGSTLVASCNAMAPLVKNGPVMYCFSPGVHPPAGSYMFSAGVSTFDQANALVRYFRLRGWTKLALMTSTDATGQDADRGFAKLLGKGGNKDLKLVAHVHFNPTDVSVDAQLEKVKQAAPQAFIGWATGAPSATIFRDAEQAGLSMPMGTTGGNMSYAQMSHFAAFLPKQLYLPSGEWPIGDDPRGDLQPSVKAKQKQFYAAFKAAGEKPDEGSVLAWDPATILVDALRKLPEGASAAQLHDYLIHLKEQAGVSGVYDFQKTPQRGLSLEDDVVTRWSKKAGRWVLVSKPTGIPLP